MEFTIKIKPEDLHKLEAALKNPERLMNRLGPLVVAQAQEAFRNQSFDGKQWQPRYPSQDTPKFNIAGALMDWKSGASSPKANRFSDRPAAIDSQNLKRSVNWQVTGPYSFEVGTVVPYAGIQHDGGHVSIPYDQGTKERISKWLYGSKPAGPKGKFPASKARKAKAPAYIDYFTGERSQKLPVSAYEKHVRPLLFKNSWRQSVIARPFIGMTKRLESDMNEAVKDFFSEMGI